MRTDSGVKYENWIRLGHCFSGGLWLKSFIIRKFRIVFVVDIHIKWSNSIHMHSFAKILISLICGAGYRSLFITPFKVIVVDGGGNGEKLCCVRKRWLKWKMLHLFFFVWSDTSGAMVAIFPFCIMYILRRLNQKRHGIIVITINHWHCQCNEWRRCLAWNKVLKPKIWKSIIKKNEMQKAIKAVSKFAI